MYKYAQRVVVWLGDDADDEELVLQLVFDVINQALTTVMTRREPVWIPMTNSGFQLPFEYPSLRWTRETGALYRACQVGNHKGASSEVIYYVTPQCHVSV